MLDLIVRGGDLVDGTGRPRWRADVGVRNGRVVAVGALDESAHRVIDAEGRIVAPGFIDVHTHYDAQVFWDPYLTPSLLHGVTTALGGNCGFTIAPLAPEAGDYLMRLLAHVEGMPLETLQAGVPWNWRSTAEYFDSFEESLAINAGFMAGHSTIRRLVMGEEATQRPATTDEVGRMRALFRESLAAGALGFSSSWGLSDRDAVGDPVPSRLADADELVALAEVCREFEGTSLEFLPDSGAFEKSTEVMARMSVAAQRPLNWNSIFLGLHSIEASRAKLEAGTYARARGGRVVALALPQRPVARWSFRTGFGLDMLPEWGKPMALPAAEKLAMLRNPAQRRRLEDLAAQPSSISVVLADWPNRVISETFSPETKRYEGRIVGDIAIEEGKRPFDVLCDIVCADELRTLFVSIPQADTDDDWRERLGILRDERTLIGGSDAGAHLDFLDSFNLQTSFLGEVVRQRELMSIEEGIHHFTDAPARLYGLRDRGRVMPGAHADLVILDETAIGSGPVHTRTDLPTGAPRLYANAFGIDHVLVNGVPVVDHGETIDERPGRILRSGRDTDTPSLDD